MNTGTKGDKSIKSLVVANCWQYLYENFHKFSETNKIKIALELAKKDIPVEVAGEIAHTHFFEAMCSRVDSLPSRIERYATEN
jgi:hypothetical protein